MCWRDCFLFVVEEGKSPFFLLTNSGTKNFDPSACLTMQKKFITIFIPQIPSLFFL
jgi:hypothetical protein